jgi:hypothetical protein
MVALFFCNYQGVTYEKDRHKCATQHDIILLVLILVDGGLPQMYTNNQRVEVLLDPENPGVSKLPYTTNVTIPPWISFGITVVLLIVFLVMRVTGLSCLKGGMH